MSAARLSLECLFTYAQDNDLEADASRGISAAETGAETAGYLRAQTVTSVRGSAFSYFGLTSMQQALEI